MSLPRASLLQGELPLIWGLPPRSMVWLQRLQSAALTWCHVANCHTPVPLHLGKLLEG